MGFIGCYKGESRFCQANSLYRVSGIMGSMFTALGFTLSRVFSKPELTLQPRCDTARKPSSSGLGFRGFEYIGVARVQFFITLSLDGTSAS